MATAKARKPAAKKRTVRKKKKPARFSGRVPISRILLFLALLTLLLVSIGAAGYVIFFRVVVASAEHDPIGRSVLSMTSTPAPLQIVAERLPNQYAGSPYKRYTGAER